METRVGVSPLSFSEAASCVKGAVGGQRRGHKGERGIEEEKEKQRVTNVRVELGGGREQERKQETKMKTNVEQGAG